MSPVRTRSAASAPRLVELTASPAQGVLDFTFVPGSAEVAVVGVMAIVVIAR